MLECRYIANSTQRKAARDDPKGATNIWESDSSGAKQFVLGQFSSLSMYSHSLQNPGNIVHVTKELSSAKDGTT